MLCHFSVWVISTNMKIPSRFSKFNYSSFRFIFKKSRFEYSLSPLRAVQVSVEARPSTGSASAMSGGAGVWGWSYFAAFLFLITPTYIKSTTFIISE